MTPDKQGKRRGRPLMEKSAKRRNFTFRVSDQLYDRLRSRAAENGRSASEEIEWRLGLSFEREEWTREMLAVLRSGDVK